MHHIRLILIFMKKGFLFYYRRNVFFVHTSTLVLVERDIGQINEWSSFEKAVDTPCTKQMVGWDTQPFSLLASYWTFFVNMSCWGGRRNKCEYQVPGTSHNAKDRLWDFRTNERANRREDRPYMTCSLDIVIKILKLLDLRTDSSSKVLPHHFPGRFYRLYRAV